MSAVAALAFEHPLSEVFAVPFEALFSSTACSAANGIIALCGA